MKSLVFLLLAIVTLGASTPAQGAEVRPTRERAFWQAIVDADYKVPEGESPLELLRELSGLLSSVDPELRDGFGYSIAARWIYVQELYSPEELLTITELWMANLRNGIGETGSDRVLLRSFSALDLSILAALDNKSPFLGEKDFRKFLDGALQYMTDEKDVRGYLPGKGWLHSPAHTADLLKFLARSRHLQGPEQARILEAIGTKLDAPDGKVYVHGEDERMARAVLSILYREDLDGTGFRRWLGALGSMGEGLWEGDLDPQQFAAVQNTKNLLRSLHVLLSVPAKEEEKDRAARLEPMRQAVLETVAGL